MAKRNRQNGRAQEASEGIQAMRRANWKAKAAAMAEGRRERAATYADRKRVADKRACRDRHRWE